MSHLNLTITEIHALYLSGLTTPLNIVNEVINALEQDKNNILEATMYEEARVFAASLKEVEPDNLLWGIPFLIKDNLATQGIETTGSSNLLKGYIPLFDAEVVTRLKNLKAIPIAKTALDELGMGGSGTTGHRGVTYNPYGEPQTRIVGGSSSGSASGVASGYVPFALGSDTGDSIRKPASYAGLVGYKPTWGLVSRFGLFGFMPSLDTIGFFTRSVYEAGVLLEVVQGNDKKDFTSSVKEVKVLETITHPLAGKKIAVLKPIYDVYTNQNLLASFDKLILELRKKGAIVDFIPFSKSLLNAVFPTYMLLSSAETTASNANLTGVNFGNKIGGETYEELLRNTRGAFSSRIKYRFMLGTYALKKDSKTKYYDRAQRARRLIVEATNVVFEDYDAIMLPASPSHAPRVDAKPEAQSEVEQNFMAIGNFGGYPSITVPLALSEGLPLGVNITSQTFKDDVLLNIAYQIEEITGLYNLNVGNKQ